ncbi:uncharacterized protein LOC144990926 isoform X5 [Oryzias latipes]
MCAGSTFSHRSRLSPAAAAGVAHRHRPVRSVDTREPAVSTTKRTSRGEIPPVFGAPMGPGESSGGHMMPGGSMGSQFIGQQSYGDAVSKGYGQPVMYGRPGAAYNPGSAYGGSAPSVVSSPSGSVAVQLLQHDGQFLQPHFVVMRMVPKWCAAPGWLCGCPEVMVCGW